jgi:hypothetical protein
MQVHHVRVRGPTGIPGGHRIYALESPVLEGLSVGVGETIGFPDEGLNHEGKYDLPDDGIGVGIAQLGNGLTSDGVDGIGSVGVGEIMGFEREEPD